MIFVVVYMTCSEERSTRSEGTPLLQNPRRVFGGPPPSYAELSPSYPSPSASASSNQTDQPKARWKKKNKAVIVLLVSLAPTIELTMVVTANIRLKNKASDVGSSLE